MMEYGVRLIVIRLPLSSRFQENKIVSVLLKDFSLFLGLVRMREIRIYFSVSFFSGMFNQNSETTLHRT